MASGRAAQGVRSPEVLEGSPVESSHLGRRARIAGGVALFCCLTAYCAVVSVPNVFSDVWPGDEGYMLVSLREFIAHGHLYDETYTQYGPFYFAMFTPIFRFLGVTPDLTSGRLIAELAWVATSAACGLTAVRITGRWLLGALAMFAVFWYLAGVEPMHPGGLIALLLALLVLTCSVRSSTRVGRFRAPVVGGLLMALCLIKINVGGFAVIGVAVLIATGSARMSTWQRRAVVGVVLLLPWALLAPDLGQRWALQLAVVVFLANVILALALVVEPGPDTELGWRGLAAGAGAVGAYAVGYALITGTSIGGLWDGVIAQPLHHREAFTLAYTPDRTLPILAVCVALVPLYLYVRRAAPPRVAACTSGAVAAVVGALLFTSLVRAEAWGQFLSGVGAPWQPDHGVLTFVPLAGVLALPPVGIEEGASRTTGRRALAAVAILQILHIYPVAGTQTRWATFLVLTLAVVAFGDACAVLALFAPRISGAPVVIVSAALLFALVLDGRFYPPFERYRDLEPLSLSGARGVRGDAQVVTGLQTVTEVLRSDCDTFYSIPGLNIFYIFADLPPPNGLNSTTWPTLFDDSMQRLVVKSLRHVRRLCVVRDDAAMGAWLAGKPVPGGPLIRYLNGVDHEIGRAGTYVITTRP